MRSSRASVKRESALEAFVCQKCEDAGAAARKTHMKEVWEGFFGTIDTREKFLDKRLELAQHEWRA